ncbi:dGTP triphosphohydrolase [Pullulanibacillus camelliae]|uniref:dGTP triphosphohydrolase n=2 Tax=Pullulanibacillus camelliae TaxID=1707096 RepID=A0A8J2VMF2_9BACL|nr:dGTP triphosphohydrolase [Pullulanibacillus camelliae]
MYVDIVIVVTAIIIMNVLSPSKNFIISLSIVLALGFFLLFYCFFTRASLAVQMTLMIEHILLTASLILMWLIFALIKRLLKDIEDLRRRVIELEKFDGASALLTQSEFMNRVSLITTGTKRRGETNFYLKFRVHVRENTIDAMHYIFAEALLHSVRHQFDLVTRLSNDHYLVFLQNTNEQGAHTVVDRLFHTLRHQLNLLDIPVTYEMYHEDAIDRLDDLSLKELLPI